MDNCFTRYANWTTSRILHIEQRVSQPAHNDNFPEEADKGAWWEGFELEKQDRTDAWQCALPSFQTGVLILRRVKAACDVPWPVPVPNSSSRESVRIHQETQPEPSQSEGEHSVRSFVLKWLTCRKQCLDYIPDLCNTILDLNWNWIPSCFQHILTSALQFICMKDIWVQEAEIVTRLRSLTACLIIS